MTFIIYGVILIAYVLSGPTLQLALAQPSGIKSSAVLDHLNAAIDWYRHLAEVDTSAGSPSDELYLQNARTQAFQALQLAFQSAQSEAVLLQGQSESTPAAASSEESEQRNIAKAAADVASRVAQTQSQIDKLNQRIKGAGGKNRQGLLSQRDALQAELDLEKALQDAITKMAGFISTNENTGLAGEINKLKATVPELASTTGATAKPSPVKEAPKSSRASASGLIGQTSILLSQIGDVRGIDGLMSETTKLRGTAERLFTPLRDSLRSLLREGRDAINQPASQTGAPRPNLGALTAQFKQAANAAVPLRQEMILLDQVRANLLEWRKSVEREYSLVLRSILTRVVVILIALGVVMLFSDVWRRATHRYVHEVRRRRQVLLLRRFLTGFLMVIVIILGFVSEFSSLATFAGFLTAGMAVALQTVIVSIAAYFFLIGRFGVRVGDRITVSGVTGDVIDIGLVRLHLMELAGTGINLYPTGRVVVFSNSVLFQGSPLFKQLPGTAYTWHEVAVVLSPKADYGLAEKRLLEAVNSVYAEYQQDIERQHGSVQRLVDAEVPVPIPQGHLHFIDTGLEFVGRYPVDIRRASEIDNQVIRRLMELIENEPELKAAVSGVPKLRSAIKG